MPMMDEETGDAGVGNAGTDSSGAGSAPVRRGVRTARDSDLPAVLQLLEACDLPTDGVAGQFGPGYAVFAEHDLPAGVAGVEVYESDGLLRSVAVLPGRQGEGIGAALVCDRIAWAKRSGLRALYLLTSTAPEFFARLGFARIGRESAPEAVRASREFAHICPSSSIVMRLDL